MPSSLEANDRLATELAKELACGKSIVSHCRQGIGRSSLLAASILVRSGDSATQAWQRIEAARGRPVPDTEEQRRWLDLFAVR